MAVALLGVTATVVAEHVLPEEPKPKLETAVSVNIGRLNLGWRSKSQPPAAPEPLLSRGRVRFAGIGLGIAALPLAVVSWARRERAWWGVGICGFAVAAIAWQTVVIVFALLALSGLLALFVPTGGPPATE
jgi:hypothetical protein